MRAACCFLGCCALLAAGGVSPGPSSGFAWYSPLPQVSPPGRLVRAPLPWDVWEQGTGIPDGLMLLAGRDVPWPFSLYLAKGGDTHVGEWSEVPLRTIPGVESPGGSTRWSARFEVEKPGWPVHRLTVHVPVGTPMLKARWFGRDAPQGEWQWLADGLVEAGRGQLESDRCRHAEIRLDLSGADIPEAPVVRAEKAQAYVLYQATSFPSLRLYYGGTPGRRDAPPAGWTTQEAFFLRSHRVETRVRRPAFDGELTQRLKQPVFFSVVIIGSGLLALLVLATGFRRNTR